jgi:hypothetical protein
MADCPMCFKPLSIEDKHRLHGRPAYPRRLLEPRRVEEVRLDGRGRTERRGAGSRDGLKHRPRVREQTRARSALPICVLPVKPGESVRFEHGEVIHVECSLEKKQTEKPTDR